MIWAVYVYQGYYSAFKLLVHFSGGNHACIPEVWRNMFDAFISMCILEYQDGFYSYVSLGCLLLFSFAPRLSFLSLYF